MDDHHYEAVRRAFQTAAAARAAALGAACDLPPDELALHQQVGWEAALAHARAASPWHAERLAGLPADAHPEQVPTMTREDLDAHFDRIVAHRLTTRAGCEARLAAAGDRPAFVDDHHLVLTSGGTSGRRGVFVWSRPEVVGVFLSMGRWVGRGPLGGEPPRRLATVGAGSARHATAAVGAIFAPAGEAAPGDEHGVDRPGAGPGPGPSSFPVDLPLPEIVSGLNRARPDLLVVYGSMIPLLAEEAAAGRLTIGPRAVVATSEPLPPNARPAARAAWGTEIVDCYGTSEAGIVACGCGFAPGLHLNEDLVLVEAVDGDGRPVPTGERSARVLVTPLGGGHALPLVRYQLDDEVVPLAEPCPCGSAFRRIAAVTGRADELLTWGTTVVHPHVLRAVVAGHPGVLEYQVRATAGGVHVDVRPGRAGVRTGLLRADLHRALTRAGLADPQVTVDEVAAVARTETGKIRRFVPAPAAAGVGPARPPRAPSEA